MPLVAIANPAQYVIDPLRVFELDFEANLAIVRLCVKYRKRLMFPSTSEIYGMSPDAVLHEETSPLVYGPVNKQRWIYAASKQLLDRVIFAYGVRDNFDYTLFRPFNFIGPNLDNVDEPKEGSSRVFTQFLSNIMYRRPILLVDGGEQKRSFTYIDDAIDCLLRMIENPNGVASRRIFNIGNPANCVSIGDLARMMVAVADGVSGAARARAGCADDLRDLRRVLRQVLPGHPGARAVGRRGARGSRLGATTDLPTAVRKTIAYYVELESSQRRSGEPFRIRGRLTCAARGASWLAAGRAMDVQRFRCGRCSIPTKGATRRFRAKWRRAATG